MRSRPLKSIRYRSYKHLPLAGFEPATLAWLPLVYIKLLEAALQPEHVLHLALPAGAHALVHAPQVLFPVELAIGFNALDQLGWKTSRYYDSYCLRRLVLFLLKSVKENTVRQPVIIL